MLLALTMLTWRRASFSAPRDREDDDSLPSSRLSGLPTSPARIVGRVAGSEALFLPALVPTMRLRHFEVTS